jgi:hypothetical protein
VGDINPKKISRKLKKKKQIREREREREREERDYRDIQDKKKGIKTY